jgi:hypothetical protein
VDAPENARRTPRYRKDEALEVALAELNARLQAAAPRPETDAPFAGPVVFVVGPPRSGTTLLLQVLTRTRAFTYPDHVVARLPGDPAAGVLVSRSLRAQFPEAVAGPAGDAPARSDYGVTAGLFEPHEFGYFWSRVFDFSRGHALSAAQLDAADWPGLHAALRAMHAAGGGHPLLFKIVPLSMHVDALAARLPGAVFLTCHREPVDVALSMYRAREARYGDPTVWWSVRPRGHEAMAALPPVASVAAQLSGFLEAMASALARVPAGRRFELPFEPLCAAPGPTLAALDAFLTGHGLPPAVAPPRAAWFAPPRARPEDADLRAALSDALRGAGGSPHDPRDGGPA